MPAYLFGKNIEISFSLLTQVAIYGRTDGDGQRINGVQIYVKVDEGDPGQLCGTISGIHGNWHLPFKVNCNLIGSLIRVQRENRMQPPPAITLCEVEVFIKQGILKNPVINQIRRGFTSQI